MNSEFLPTTREEMQTRGWDACDVIFVSGEAYVDHPSFGVSLLGRYLESKGYKVGIIAQPDWNKDDDFTELGRPNLFFAVSAGSLDSMLAIYTPLKKKRRDDPYSPGGKAGLKPPRASITYTSKLKKLFKNVSVVLGGIEASLRRLAHYDYWDDKVRRSLIFDAKADLMVFGMGEKQILEIAERLRNGQQATELQHINGTVYKTKDKPDGTLLPSYEDVSSNKETFADFVKQYFTKRNDKLVQKHGEQYLVCEAPAEPLGTKELDDLYELPFTRRYHPKYEKEGGVPALNMVEFSITSHRGCYGGCAFCALALHQGSVIASRSKESIVNEAKRLTKMPNFKGYISDIGGPSANMYGTGCDKPCGKYSCLQPKICKKLNPSPEKWLDVLRAVRKIPEIKKVFVGTGVRHDMFVDNYKALRELCEYHIGGQLSVAPEHVSSDILKIMGKPEVSVYEEFKKLFEKINKELGKKQYLVPYFISGHPGCGLDGMIELAQKLREWKISPEQVQDFTPTPMTLATCMYYTGINPITGENLHVARYGDLEKTLQRALVQYNVPQNYTKVGEALEKAGRNDLIGNDKKCLIQRGRKKKPKRKK